jgi:hypothetical protein
LTPASAAASADAKYSPTGTPWKVTCPEESVNPSNDVASALDGCPCTAALAFSLTCALATGVAPSD